MKIGFVGRIVAIACMALHAGGPSASAEKLERYSPEYLWLTQAVSAMTSFLDMLEPVYQVTQAMVDDAPDRESYRDNAAYAIESARSRLALIHENAVWIIEILPEAPTSGKRVGARLIEQVGDLRARAEDIRLMSDTVISNFEAAVAGNANALDQGILEAVALLDTLSQMHNVVADFEFAMQADAHPLMNRATLADSATVRAVIELRQLEFLLNLQSDRPEFDRSLAEFVGLIREMRSESAEVTRLAKAHKKALAAGSESYRQRESGIVDTYLETEIARGELLSAMEGVVYQLTREDPDFEALARSMETAYVLVKFLDPKERELEQWRLEQGKPPRRPTGNSLPEAKANL